MADVGYINPEVAKMYGKSYSELTAEEKKILHADSVRRAKLIKEREEDVLRNNRKAFADEAQMEKVLGALYKNCQKQILADVAETIAKVQKAGGDWSYANQSALTRSKGLFEQIAEQINTLGQKEELVFTQGLSGIYTDQFLRELYGLGQVQAVKANFNKLNPTYIKKTLDYPWSGAMFSDRLWNDKETLGKNLRAGLTQSMILGESIPQITERINKNINTSQYNAERLARTETKRVAYVAQSEIWEDNGVTELRYMCANRGNDSRICKICLADNGKVYKKGEEPTLPRHPNCRCTYVPVAKDTFEDNELNELTGSIRGAENYEKWRTAQEKKLKKEETTLNNADKNDNSLLSDFIPAKTLAEAEDFAKMLGVKYPVMKNMSIEVANELNKALLTLPDDVRPVFLGSSAGLEKYWGGKLPRSSKHYYGVTIEIFDGIHLGYEHGVDNITGYMVGMSSSYKSFAKITASKLQSQRLYMEKHAGHKWFFNEVGETTPYHEMGHIYANVKGLPSGFVEDAKKWAEYSKCDMLLNPSEAWAEAWADYYTGRKQAPEYIQVYIANVSSKIRSGATIKSLIAYEKDAIIEEKVEQFKKDLLLGNISTVISPQKQARHMLGTKEYENYIDRMQKARKGTYPSVFNSEYTLLDIQKKVSKHLGTGVIEVNADGSIQEFFDCDEVIGYYWDNKAGRYVETNRVQVKYSSKNIHIIPVKPL